MTKKVNYGWKRDLPNHLDLKASSPQIAQLLAKAGVKPGTAKGSRKPLPSKVDLRSTGLFAPVEDQSQLGSCTANAAAGLLEFFERKATGKYVELSRLFIYKVARNLAQVTGDCGSELRTVLGVLTLFGAPPEQYWPYDITQFDQEPPAFCYALAGDFKALRYFRLDKPGDDQTGRFDEHGVLKPGYTHETSTLELVKRLLAAGLPSMFGFSVFEPEISFARSNGGLMAFPGPNSVHVGGHAVIACGYDDDLKIGSDKGAILFRNSWGAFNDDGSPVGDAGYFWMPYRYIVEELTADWWTILKEAWVDADPFQK